MKYGLEVFSLISGYLPRSRRLRKKLEQEFAEFPSRIVFRTRGGLRWYCFNSLTSLPQARTVQLNALIKQADLNIERADQKALAVQQADIAEASKATVLSHANEAERLLANPQADPNAIKAHVQRSAKLKDFVVPSLRVIENLNIEIAKRCDLLTHPEFLYRAAAIMYWVDGEDPRNMVQPDQLERKIRILKKNGTLLQLLRSPISAIFFHVEASPDDLAISLQSDLLTQEAILKFGDEIFRLVSMKSNQQTSPLEYGSEMPLPTSSSPPAPTKKPSNTGSNDPRSIFSSMLKDSGPQTGDTTNPGK